ncbi:MAG: MFS transporter [Chloroflexota bacterium]
MKIGFKRGIKTKRENWEQALYASFIAQALCILGISASFPFIPLFLMKDLNITDPASAGLWAGVMGAISSLLMAVFAPIWGIVADRYGRKMMVLRAYDRRLSLNNVDVHLQRRLATSRFANTSRCASRYCFG